MTAIFIVFWTLITFASIAWYAALLAIIGRKGGREILEMADRFRQRKQ